MRDPSEIYEVDPEVAAQVDARSAGGAGPVLVHLLSGFVDAGQAGSRSRGTSSTSSRCSGWSPSTSTSWSTTAHGGRR